MNDTLFKQVNYDLDSLVKFIELGQIGLPDIQRPSVWPNKKVRDLFDSMYRVYLVGYLLLRQNGIGSKTKRIGTDNTTARYAHLANDPIKSAADRIAECISNSTAACIQMIWSAAETSALRSDRLHPELRQMALRTAAFCLFLRCVVGWAK